MLVDVFNRQRLGLYNLDPDVVFWATPPVHGCLTPYVVHPANLTFKLPPGGAPGSLKPGDRASFEFFIDMDDLPQLTRVTPMATAPMAGTSADSKAPPVATPAAPATTGSKP